MAVAYMLAWPYGFTRVMSSYYWEQNIVNGQVIVAFHSADILSYLDFSSLES